MTAPLFDSHCHLDSDTFAPELDALLERARTAGVARIATIGCAREVASMTRAIDVARRYPDMVVATVGVHPHDASQLDESVFTSMSEAAADPVVVAIGETGLDYHYDHSPRDVQQQAFRRTIGLARSVRKPIVVHTRSAPEDTLRILREENASDVGGIIHCFSEDAAFAKQALDLGFVSSFSGIVTFKNAVAIQEAARQQPLDAILIETDAPYLAPIPHRGKRNEPAYVAHTAAFIAKLRGMDEDGFRHATAENAKRVFGLS